MYTRFASHCWAFSRGPFFARTFPARSAAAFCEALARFFFFCEREGRAGGRVSVRWLVGDAGRNALCRRNGEGGSAAPEARACLSDVLPSCAVLLPPEASCSLKARIVSLSATDVGKNRIDFTPAERTQERGPQ